MRGTSHNGRTGKDGTYSSKHNDRNFDLNNAEHIDQTQTDKNWYWHRYQKTDPKMKFEEAESKFYNDNFTDSLNAKNERYRVSGHKDRMRSMDEYRSNRLSCPEETILQVGKVGETISPDLLKQICIKHINWESKTFPNVVVLDVALHVDEEGAPHVHERKVWCAHSSDGLVVGQAKALEEMGIPRPNLEKGIDRYNNPKITYTTMCREHLLEVCKEYGLELELEPDKASKGGLKLEEYKRQQEQKKNDELTAQNAQKEREINAARENIIEAQNSLKKANIALQDKAAELQGIEAEIEVGNKQLEKVIDMKARASEIHRPFKDKETQTYHKNMLESTRKIANEARKHMEKAQAAERNTAMREAQLNERERIIDRKETNIEPLYAEALRTKNKAIELEQNAKSHIIEKARNLIKLALIPERDLLSNKMTEFMSQYKVNGVPLDKIFYEQLEKESQKMQEFYEEKIEREFDSRYEEDLER